MTHGIVKDRQGVKMFATRQHAGRYGKWDYREAMVSLDSLLLVVPMFIVACCALGIFWCHEIMLGDIEGCLSDDEEMRFPRGSWNTFEIYRLHKKYYRNSRIRSTLRFLLYVGAASFASVVLIMLYAAFSKPVAPSRIDGR